MQVPMYFGFTWFFIPLLLCFTRAPPSLPSTFYLLPSTYFLLPLISLTLELSLLYAYVSAVRTAFPLIENVATERSFKTPSPLTRNTSKFQRINRAAITIFTARPVAVGA